MELIGDVWVNWFEGEENGYNVCEFHEWRKHDFIECMDQIPLIKVSDALFNYIENDLSDLPPTLLEKIHNQSYIRKNNQRERVEYAFIATNGIAIIVVDTLGYTIPIRKSRVIPRQESAIIEQAQTMTIFQEEGQFTHNKMHHIMSPPALWMRGLTRKERQLKQLLLMVLDQLRTTGQLEEIRYWFTEWFPKRYGESRTILFDDAWRALFNDVKLGWSDKHYQLCERMIKGQSYYEKLWELEHGTAVN